MDRFVEDGCLDDNVDFLSHDDADPRDAGSHCMDSNKGVMLWPSCLVTYG